MSYGRAETLFALAAAGLCSAAGAQPFPDSLWLGTDNTNQLSVLNVSRDGTELRRLGPMEATGFAIDTANQILYIGRSESGFTQPFDLTLLTPISPGADIPDAVFMEDMAFDGRYLWRADNVLNEIFQIDPSDYSVVFRFTPDFSSAMGVAWDGTNLWLSQYTGTDGGVIEQFTVSGEPTGAGFTVSDFPVGGLAYDTTDGTLWIGSASRVYHYTTAGDQLGFFDVPPGEDRFIDGLEFEGGCRADLNGDGLVDFADYLEFLNYYDASDLRVDFNGDGLVDFADYLEFLNLYDAGC